MYHAMPVLQLKCVFRCFETMQSVCTVLYSTRYLSADLEEIKQISSMLLKSFGSSINKTLGCNNLAGKLVNADALELGHTDGKVVHYLRQSDPQAEDKKTRIIKICNARNIQVNMQLLDVHVFGPGARVSVQQQAARSNAGQQTRAQADDSQPSFPSIPSDNNMRGGAPSGSQGPVLAGRNEKGQKPPNSSTKTHETVQKMRMNSSSEKTQQNSTTPRNQKENNGRKIKKVDDWEVSGSAAEPDDFEHTPPEGRVHYKPGWGPQMPPNHGTASFGRKLDNGGNYLAIKHHTRSASTISSHPSKEEEEIMSIVRDAAGERKPSPSSCSEALKGLNNLDF